MTLVQNHQQRLSGNNSSELTKEMHYRNIKEVH